MNIKPNLRIFIAGKTQSGKTYFAKYLLSKYQRYIIYDLKREYNSFGAVVNTLEQLKTALQNGCVKVIVQPNDLSVEYFDLICEFIWYRVRNCLFVVDEVHTFCTKHKITNNFKRILTVMQGGDYKVGIICISQRPQNVHNDIISQSTIVISFRLNHNDAYALPCMPPEQVKTLQERQFLIYDDRRHDGKVTLCQPIKNG